MRPWIANSAVVVVPLRTGSGTRLKVLEALSMARPVVSTSIGVEGLDVESGRHLLIADQPEEFVAAVESILDRPGLSESLGQSGRELVRSRYDWDSVARIFEAMVVEAARRKPSEQRAPGR